MANSHCRKCKLQGAGSSLLRCWSEHWTLNPAIMAPSVAPSLSLSVSHFLPSLKANTVGQVKKKKKGFSCLYFPSTLQRWAIVCFCRGSLLEKVPLQVPAWLNPSQQSVHKCSLYTAMDSKNMLGEKAMCMCLWVGAKWCTPPLCFKRITDPVFSLSVAAKEKVFPIFEMTSASGYAASPRSVALTLMPFMQSLKCTPHSPLSVRAGSRVEQVTFRMKVWASADYRPA